MEIVRMYNIKGWYNFPVPIMVYKIYDTEYNEFTTILLGAL